MALKEAKARAEASSATLADKLAALSQEKQRAEEGVDFITAQTQLLLADKRTLLQQLAAKEVDISGLQAGLEAVQHQLEIALEDRGDLEAQLAGSGSDAAWELVDRHDS